MFLHGENVGKQWTSQYSVDYGRMHVNIGYMRIFQMSLSTVRGTQYVQTTSGL